MVVVVVLVVDDVGNVVVEGGWVVADVPGDASSSPVQAVSNRASATSARRVRDFMGARLGPLWIFPKFSRNSLPSVAGRGVRFEVVRQKGIGVSPSEGRRGKVWWCVAMGFVLVVTAGGCGGDDDSAPPPGTSVAPSTSTTVGNGGVDTTTSHAPATATTVTPGGGRVERSGVSFGYPDGWEEAGLTIATEFAADADCVAARIVDFEPPADSGQGQAGFMLQSVVQVCVQPAGNETLEQWLTSRYGGTGSFVQTEIGGLRGYRNAQGLDVLTFAQSADHLFQVFTSVAADADVERIRIDQVEAIVDSMVLS